MTKYQIPGNDFQVCCETCLLGTIFPGIWTKFPGIRQFAGNEYREESVEFTVFRKDSHESDVLRLNPGNEFPGFWRNYREFAIQERDTGNDGECRGRYGACIPRNEREIPRNCVEILGMTRPACNQRGDPVHGFPGFSMKCWERVVPACNVRTWVPAILTTIPRN